MTPDGTIEKIRQALFRPVHLRAGYAMPDVDQLLDDLVDALQGGRPIRPLLDAARLGTVSWRTAYRKEDVDQLLEELRSEP